MPRTSGTYIAPAGNPVAPGTVIQSTWANTTVTDIGNEITNSLPRDGQAPMLAALKSIDGTVSAPGLTFNSESSSGLFRPGTGMLALTISGVELLRGISGRLLIGSTTDDGTNKLQVTGAVKITGALATTSNITATGAVSASGAIHASNASFGTIGVKNGTSGSTGPSTSADDLVIEGGTGNHSGLSILVPSTQNGYVLFGDESSNLSGQLAYSNPTDTMSLVTAGTTRFSISTTAITSTLAITAPSFVGALTGNASTATTATNATNAVNVGITADATNATRYVTFVSTTTGNLPSLVDAGLTYNPSTNLLATSISGNAATATKLATARTIAGVSFDGTANISIPGSGLSGTSLAVGIVSSSLTSVGTLTALAVTGNITGADSIIVKDRLIATPGGTDPGNGVAGDVIAARSSTQGAIYLGAQTDQYLYFDGSNYNFGTGGHVKLTDGDTIAGVDIGYRNVPQNSQAAAYTCVLSDAGKHIYHPASDSTARTYTIPANASVAYPVGTCLTFVNLGSGLVTIAVTSDGLYLAGTGTTGSRTLAQYGVANALKITATGWLISGTGLS